jgi:threonine synthase
MRLLLRQGFALEMASAVPLACLERIASEENAGETWVIIGSGAAVKWGNIAEDFEMPPALNDDFAAFDAIGLD